MPSTNSDLNNAQRVKADEFYTLYETVEKELQHYTRHFRGKVVYCNCDTEESAFVRYFQANFNHLGLKTLHYGNSDFRDVASTEILEKSDIVVTNPPFSLFREFVAELIYYKKKFLIIGNLNAISYTSIFPLIKNNKIWLGVSLDGRNIKFHVPENYELNAPNCGVDVDGRKFVKAKGAVWFTNLNHDKQPPFLKLSKTFTSQEFPKYDNYNAINVNKIADIPKDYGGEMGVPISFFNKYNPDQFEIVNANEIRTNPEVPNKQHGLIKDKDGTINGKPKYVRIVIKNKQLN